MVKAGLIKFVLIAAVLSLWPISTSRAQNCCAPAVPQQGVLGETVVLPYTLEIGIHYEVMRSKEINPLCCGNTRNKKADWERATLTVSYGLLRRLSVGLIVPYEWKENSWDFGDMRIVKASDGVGDMTALLRFSLIPRDYVTYREFSLGLGLKMPTGATDRYDTEGLLLAEELQPGTGSWDYQMALSFYQGFEPVDFTISGNYIITSQYDNYEFGNQFYYLLSSSYHLIPRLDISAALSGVVRDRDRDGGAIVENTGRHQIWLEPGVQYQLMTEFLRVQGFVAVPVYQQFDGTQLGGKYNLRFSVSALIPLKKSE
jgi:hypothetical protein